MSLRFLISAGILGFAAATVTAAYSQENQPAAPAAQAPQQAPPVDPAHPFPPIDPANFDADSPSKARVQAFLQASWGYDPNRIWQIQGILKTPAPGVSRVVVLVSEMGQPKQNVGQLTFYTLPGGDFIIADAVLPFGAKPFAGYRQILQQQAKGPWAGSPSKALELVEFSDFQCPHCKEAQDTVHKILADYPTAHFVYENYPLTALHSEAFKAAAYGQCVAQLSGNPAFFKFADQVFANQSGLTPETSDQTLKEAASHAGADPAKVAACSTSPETKAAVDASVALAKQLSVAGTPTIFINGRGLPLGGLSYATLRAIINFQAKEDGITLPPAPLKLTGPAASPD